MAVTKIHAVRTTEIKALRYITNPEKTKNSVLVSSYGCSGVPEEAHEDFSEIRSCGAGRNEILSHHIIQSFNGQEVTPEQALAIGNELCKNFLKGNYQYVLAVHTDADNVHLHIIFNAVNLWNGKTFETLEDRKQDKAWARLQQISDEICKEHGLYVIKNPQHSRGKSSITASLSTVREPELLIQVSTNFWILTV